MDRQGNNDITQPICSPPDCLRKQAEQSAILKVMGKQIDEIHTVVRGNGKPGLVVEMDRINQREAQRLKRDEDRKKTDRMLIACACGALLSFIGSVAKDWVV